MKARASVKLFWDSAPLDFMVNLATLNSSSIKTKQIPFKTER